MRRRSKRFRRGPTFVVAAFLVGAAVFGALMVEKYQQSRKIPTAVQPPPAGGSRSVALFFADPETTGLVREGREVDACDALPVCINEVVGELVNGPVGDLGPTLPDTTTVRGVRVAGDLATIDLGRGTVEGLPAGSAAELLAVYSIIDTVAANFPQIRRVAFLVEGAPVETLKGHVDLRRPLPPDFSLVRSDAGGVGAQKGS